jgi:hypothetical protein
MGVDLENRELCPIAEAARGLRVPQSTLRWWWEGTATRLWFDLSRQGHER